MIISSASETKLKLSPENDFWLKEFQRKMGRPPCVLHIGNIANNAFNNAKLLNEAGLDCDVICYDYYHIMGCPEWEDADFDGAIEDQFYPDWSKIDLKGFQRPRWFVQGPVDECIEYLLAKRSNNLELANNIWTQLSVWNRNEQAGAIERSKSWLWRTLTRIRNALAYMVSGRNIASHIANKCDSGSISTFIKGETMRLVVALIYIIVTLIVRIGSYPFKVLISQHPFNDRIKELINIYASSFPEREDNLTFADLDIYRHSICKWSRLFKCYDIILAYSTDPRIPMIAGVRYVAFEHGTIREIPYQQTSEGRATALSYRLADHVFVTNADCLESADKLSPQKYTMINHPYDEDHWMGVSDWKVLQKKLCKILDSELLFFFPTRHDWIPDTGYADKANDVFLRAFCMLRNKGFSVGLVCANWGSNVHESKELLNKMGCSPYVLWKEPMGTVAFERMAMACCFVVDQFKLGAFGGIVFKAMAVGSPIITYLDPKKVMKQYPEIPPVVNCKTEREIVDQVSILATDRDRLTSIGELSRAWIKKYHSKKDTVNLQIDCFRKLDANVAQFTPTEGVWNERYNSKGVGHNYG